MYMHFVYSGQISALLIVCFGNYIKGRKMVYPSVGVYPLVYIVSCTIQAISSV